MQLKRYDPALAGVLGTVLGLKLNRNEVYGGIDVEWAWYRNGKDSWEVLFQFDDKGRPRWAKCMTPPDMYLDIDELDPQDVLEIAEGM